VVLLCSLQGVLAHPALCTLVRQLLHCSREMPFRRRLAGSVWTVASDGEDYFLPFMAPLSQSGVK
jgi:hypothetical protein